PYQLPFQEFDLNAWRTQFGMDNHSSTIEMTAEFDPRTLKLVLAGPDDLIEGVPIENMLSDFWNRPQIGKAVIPGPFGSSLKGRAPIVVDPRLAADEISLH